MTSGSSHPATTFFARISADDTLLYGNSALAEYLRLKKEDLPSTPLEVLRGILSGELGDCFKFEQPGGASNRLVTDGRGRVFEVVVCREGGVLDLILNEVTDAGGVLESLGATFGLPGEELTEEEIRAIWHPERRILTLSQTRLSDLQTLAAHLAPVEMRLLLNTFLEESCEAILETSSAVGAVETDRVQGIYGAPRHYRDHALRGLQSAFRQMERARQLRAGVAGQGRQLPPLAIGLATGEVLLSSLAAPTGVRLSASGPLVALTRQLGRLARPGEILLSEFTLRAILETLPEGWEVVRAEAGQEPDLSDVVWQGDEIQGLPPELDRGVYLLGPGVEESPGMAEFYLDYLYAIRAEGFDEPVPVLRVVRPETAGSAIGLSEDNLVSTPVVQVLGKYKLLGVVGQGGMGKVWKGMDRFGNVVAVKVLNAGESAGEEALRRFEREAEIMGRLPHRNICRIFEINEYEGMRFIVMEYVDGLTLADLLYEGVRDGETGTGGADLPGLIRSLRTSRQEGESGDERSVRVAESAARPRTNRILPIEQTLAIFGKICDAIQFAHEHGVLHRDLKPGNVLLREDGEPLVADFGLAKLEGASGMSLSVSGYMVGTLENMAPEQAESSKDVDERADVFSLGTILFQMLTGRRHFEATGNLVADAQFLKTYTPPRLRSFNPGLDSDLELICQKALRPEREQRYRSVEALKADLERYRRGEVISARPVTGLELTRKLLKKHRSLTAAVSVFLLVLSGVAIWSFWEINERRIVAEEALLVAEDETRRADEALLEAERQRKVAEERQREAEAALAAKSDALNALQLAQAETQQARQAEISATKETERAQQETATERTERLKLETAARAMEEELAQIRNREPEVMAGDSDYPDEVVEIPWEKQQELLGRARDAFRRAGSIFLLQFSPYELQRLSRSPREVLERVTQAMDGVSQSLTADRKFQPALLLKARLHGILGEWDAMQETLEAMEPENSRRPRFHEVLEDGAILLGAVSRGRTPSEKQTEVLKALDGQRSVENETTARLIRFFGQASSLRRSGGAGGAIERGRTLGEGLLGLMDAHPGSEMILECDFSDPARASLTIYRAGELRDFSALQGLNLTEIAIFGASVLDWEGLGRMSPRVLAVKESKLTEAPPARVGLLPRVVEADFSGTKLEGTAFLRGAGSLEKLNLSGTGVSDLSGLDSPRLRILNLEGLRPESLAPLARLPLHEVTLDAELAAEADKLMPLRLHRTLKVLRAPEDAPGQSVQIFWQKLDAGGYAGEGADGEPGAPIENTTEEF